MQKYSNWIHDSPMRYGVVDLTGRHAPSQSILKPWYEWLQTDFYKQIMYRRHKISEKEIQMILGLVGADDTGQLS
jgi:hypothetical protein